MPPRGGFALLPRMVVFPFKTAMRDFYWRVSMQKKHFVFVLLTLVCCLTGASEAFAGAGQGGGLPYEGWLESVRASATGPVAYAFGLIGIVVAGGVLIFGGDLNGFFRSMLVVVLVMALLVTANTVMVDLFGTSAEIACVMPEEAESGNGFNAIPPHYGDTA